VPAVPVRVEAVAGTERFAAPGAFAMIAAQGPAGPVWLRALPTVLELSALGQFGELGLEQFDRADGVGRGLADPREMPQRDGGAVQPARHMALGNPDFAGELDLAAGQFDRTRDRGPKHTRKFKGPLAHSQLRRTSLMVCPSPPSLAPARESGQLCADAIGSRRLAA